MKVDSYLTPYTKNSSKWIIDVNIRAKTIKLLGVNIGTNLCDHGLGDGLIDITPKAQTTKEKMNKLDFTKLKTSVLQRSSSRK